ncbi:phosphoethanolamine transferase [Halosquirtibacter xylanolyticus]|uniref:phosphoethanolamine transferase n=1 Tax=Halosquirtibacter xylanolyticus TaxID=3374599 RepID=UPI0037499819|nr:phosphoethanolamine transferase [Prolixibacteraceae bacterium]
MKIKSSIINYINTFLCVLILNLPNIFYVILCNETTTSTLLKRIVLLVLGLLFTSIPLVLFKPKRVLVWMGLLLPVTLGAILNTIILRSPLNINIILTTINSNLSEAMELIGSSKMFIILALMSVLIYCLCVMKIDRNFIVHKRARFYFILCFILFYTALMFRNYRFTSTLTNNQSERISKAIEFHLFRLNKIFPTNIPLIGIDIIDFVQLSSDYEDAVKTYQFDVDASKSKDVDLVFLLVGESSRYDHWRIHGYHRNTSPNLDTLSNLISFHHCIAPANLTNESVPLMLTMATVENKWEQFRSKTLVSSFKKAGFRTHWYSNQYYGATSIMNRYKNEAEEQFVTHTRIESSSEFDINLVEILEEHKCHLSKGKHFVLLHTMGSHFRYNKRYPSSFNQFKPTIEENMDVLSIQNNRDEMINSYDNTILYTDHIIYQIISILKKLDRSSLLLYVPDHGEALGENNSFFHGNTMPLKQELHVPMFMWYSSHFKQRNQSLLNELESKKREVFQTDRLPLLLWDIAKIHTRFNTIESYRTAFTSSNEQFYVLGDGGKRFEIDQKFDIVEP